MDPQDIEANIKSLLGLNLGGGLPQVVPENGGPPPIRPPGSVGPPGLGPLLGPPGVIMPPMPEHQLLLDQGIAEPAQGQPDAGGIITIESDSPIPSPRLSAQRSEKDLEDQLREEAAVEAIWQGPEEYKASQRTVEYLETRHLYPLKSKSAKFPRARWFCRLCEYHCDNLVKCREHYTDTRHSRLARSKEVPDQHDGQVVKIHRKMLPYPTPFPCCVLWNLSRSLLQYHSWCWFVFCKTGSQSSATSLQIFTYE